MKPTSKITQILILSLGLVCSATAFEVGQLKTVYKGSDISLLFEDPGWVVCGSADAAKALGDGLDEAQQQNNKMVYVNTAELLIQAGHCMMMPAGSLVYVHQVGDDVSGITYIDHRYGQIYLYIPNSWWKPGHDAKQVEKQ